MVASGILGVLAAASFLYFRSSLTLSPVPEQVVPGPDALEDAQAAAQATAQQPGVPRSAVPTRRNSIVEDASRAAVADLPSSPAAEQAVVRLSKLESGKPLTAEQAAAIQLDLKGLVQEGQRAIPAIRKFMELNKDVSLDEIKGGAPVGFSSLRAALFDALHQIAGPEAQAALADILRTTGDPGEVGLLAHHLEELAPGQHREEILGAARDVLAQLAESKGKTDVAPLFQVLQTYGEAAAVADLQRALPEWKYYGLMALAGLPGGLGVPTLIEQSRQLGSGGKVLNIFASQMLAQVAPQYPEAASALLEEVKAGQIPDAGWRRIGEALAGDQYQYTKNPIEDPAVLLNAPAVKTFHMGNSAESFYSLPLDVNDPKANLDARRALLDQLLAAATGPAAVGALQQAKARLDSGN